MLRLLILGGVVLPAIVTLAACGGPTEKDCSDAHVSNILSDAPTGIFVDGSFPDANTNGEQLIMYATPPGGSQTTAFPASSMTVADATIALSPGTYTNVQWVISGCGDGQVTISGPTTVTVSSS